MGSSGKASKNGEISMTDNSNRSGDVHIMIHGEERSKNSFDSNAGISRSPSRMSFPSPGSARKPPKIPDASNRKSLARSMYSKPKSRFGEQSPNIDEHLFEDIREEHASRTNSPNNHISKEHSVSLSLASFGMASPWRGDDENEEIYKKVNVRNDLKDKGMKWIVLIESVVFVCIMVCLIVCLVYDKFGKMKLFGLEIWKWTVLVLVTFCGMLVTKWIMNFIVFLIELNFLFKNKVLYFIHGLKRSVQVCIWLGLVLATWAMLFDSTDLQRSPIASRILHIVAWTIITCLIGSFLWMIKTVLLKILASTFNANTFFDRIQESILHQFILKTLSGPPVIEEDEMIGRTNNVGEFSFQKTPGRKGERKEKVEVIDMNKLHEMKQDQVSAWTMTNWIDAIANSRLSTLSNALDESSFGEIGGQLGKEITNEMEAIAASYHIFLNVVPPGCKDIEEPDLRRFMTKEQVDVVFSLIDTGDTGKITKKALTNWVVKVYNSRKALTHALNDTKTAVKQLDKLVTGVLMIIIIIIWLLLLEIATTKVLVLLSSQFVAAAFIFKNACKTIFEAIIFVFVVHPFDVGDRCVVDGVQMIVEEMHILTTVFLRYDNEKIYYPNAILAEKPISNFYRSPDMGDAFDFTIDFATPVQKIVALKEKTKIYFKNHVQYFHPNYSIMVKEVENVDKLVMGLYFCHTMNFQDFGEKVRRRSELVLEMKKIFEELNISYNLLPQEVHLLQRHTATTGTSK